MGSAVLDRWIGWLKEQVEETSPQPAQTNPMSKVIMFRRVFQPGSYDKFARFHKLFRFLPNLCIVENVTTQLAES